MFRYYFFERNCILIVDKMVYCYGFLSICWKSYRFILLLYTGIRNINIHFLNTYARQVSLEKLLYILM